MRDHVSGTGLDAAVLGADLANAFRALPCQDAIIDGEIVALDEKGMSPLRCSRRFPAERATSWCSTPLTFFISTAGICRLLRWRRKICLPIV